MRLTKIQRSKLIRSKEAIKGIKERSGTLSAIYYAEGVAGVSKGNLIKTRPAIRAFVRRL